MSGNPDSTGPQALDGLDHERRAVAMRRRGATYEAIGRKLKITRQAAHAAVKRALARAIEEVADEAGELVELECQRLDALHRTLWPKARAGDLDALDRVLKIAERRAKLLGLDAAQRTEVSGPGGGAIPIDDARAMLAAAIADAAKEPDPGAASGGAGEPPA